VDHASVKYATDDDRAIYIPQKRIQVRTPCTGTVDDYQSMCVELLYDTIRYASHPEKDRVTDRMQRRFPEYNANASCAIQLIRSLFHVIYVHHNNLFITRVRHRNYASFVDLTRDALVPLNWILLVYMALIPP